MPPLELSMVFPGPLTHDARPNELILWNAYKEATPSDNFKPMALRRRSLGAGPKSVSECVYPDSLFRFPIDSFFLGRPTDAKRAKCPNRRQYGARWFGYRAETHIIDNDSYVIAVAAWRCENNR
jgi:hypothetical protein